MRGNFKLFWGELSFKDFIEGEGLVFSKGPVFFKSGYPVGVFLRGAKLLAKILRGLKITRKILRGVKFFS